MRFGWLTLGLSPSADGDYAAIHEQLAQACFAETAGFDGIWLTEHNFTGESVYCDPIEDGARYSLQHSALYGTARRVAEQVAELRETGVHHVLCQMSTGYLPHARVMESTRRFGAEVIPKFR